LETLKEQRLQCLEDTDQKGSESGTQSNSEKSTQRREKVAWGREDFGTKWSMAQR
jgi:hypothetical protein